MSRSAQKQADPAAPRLVVGMKWRRFILPLCHMEHFRQCGYGAPKLRFFITPAFADEHSQTTPHPPCRPSHRGKRHPDEPTSRRRAALHRRAQPWVTLAANEPPGVRLPVACQHLGSCLLTEKAPGPVPRGRRRPQRHAPSGHEGIQSILPIRH